MLRVVWYCILPSTVQYRHLVTVQYRHLVTDRVQRKCLAVCLGAPVTSGIDALEVEAQVTPLDLRRQDLAVREFTKSWLKKITRR